MNSFLRSTALFLIVATVLNACRKDDKGPDEPPSAGEFRFIRLLTSDAATSELTFVTPSNGDLQTFQAAHPNAALYSTASRRFSGLVFGTQNFVQFFDSGLEFHGDHVDVKGTPKFAAITSSAIKPAHFKSHGDEALIFNDGEGTLSMAREQDFHISGKKMDIVDAGILPHHGAMAAYDNGTYAITLSDPANPAGGPHGVKIIDRNGSTVYGSHLRVSRLHGNAGDGKNALFGAAEGVLVVKDNGEQRLIPYPATLGDQRLGTIVEAKGAKSFFGFNATKGVYRIDIINDIIVPVSESSSIMQFKINYPGDKMVTLDFDGTAKIIDALTGSIVTAKKIVSATDVSSAARPLIDATSRYLYVTIPNEGKVKQFSASNLDEVQTFNVSANPSRIAVFGFETDESH